jgi:hypothetical protein
VVGVELGTAVAVAVRLVVTVGVTTGGQLLRALPTAIRISLIVTAPSPLASKGGQALSAASPSAMLMPVISSSMVTSPLPLQSPTQATADWACAATGEQDRLGRPTAITNARVAAHASRVGEWCGNIVAATY